MAQMSSRFSNPPKVKGKKIDRRRKATGSIKDRKGEKAQHNGQSRPLEVKVSIDHFPAH